MLTKIIVVLALSVANASVIINVFDEDPEISVSKPIHLGDCNYQACDQQCRRLGFTGGACINGRCKCDINRESITETEVVHLEDCNNQACDQRCRDIFFTGGICVNGFCKCDINKREDPEVLSELDKSANLFDCNPQACDQQCRNMGFTGGVCVHDRCKCDINKEKVPEKTIAGLTKSLHSRDCNDMTCDQTCQKFGYPSGYCIDGDCECINRKKASLLVDDVSSSVNEEHKEGKPSFNLPRACDVIKCNDMCHSLNYLGGICLMDGECQCF